MNYPPITIVMTTYFMDEQRRDLAKLTLKTWNDFLFYEGELHLHIADDDSIITWEPENFWNYSDITYSWQERQGVGASLNQGFLKAYETSPLVAYFVDDWILQEELDLSPWAKLLMEREDVGIVRLGPPHPFLRGTIEAMTDHWQGWALRLERYGLTVGHRPELFHKRYTDFYGMWDENINAQEVERLASVRYADMPNGPDIVYALPHKWFHYHLDKIPSTSHINPSEG